MERKLPNVIHLLFLSTLHLILYVILLCALNTITILMYCYCTCNAGFMCVCVHSCTVWRSVDTISQTLIMIGLLFAASPAILWICQHFFLISFPLWLKDWARQRWWNPARNSDSVWWKCFAPLLKYVKIQWRHILMTWSKSYRELFLILSTK